MTSGALIALRLGVAMLRWRTAIPATALYANWLRVAFGRADLMMDIMSAQRMVRDMLGALRRQLLTCGWSKNGFDDCERENADEYKLV